MKSITVRPQLRYAFELWVLIFILVAILDGLVLPLRWWLHHEVNDSLVDILGMQLIMPAGFTFIWIWYRRISWEFSGKGITRRRGGEIQGAFAWEQIKSIAISKYGAKVSFDSNKLRRRTLYILGIQAKQLVDFIPKAKLEVAD